jgi:hypothetical protein
MKDHRGLYYYPNPLNTKFRTYVREADGSVWFRLWNSDDPELWEEHGWVPYEAIKKAADMYAGTNFDPKQAYDMDLARALIKEDRQRRG